ncbi:MAG: hypothetical protein HQL51_02155 [Magnetococcales bacterium]|nr:hypothetical protein [Magnetococcales bacterium]
MIRIRKPATPPAILAQEGKGPAATEELLRQYEADPAGFRGGTRSFTFDKKIYGAPEVKTALQRAQHDKCCFCECKISNHPGDVEHFRPKRGVKQRARNQKMGKPGYYWLAYDWSNLYLACEDCNRRHKGNLFPLENAHERAKFHGEDLSREKPLFIDPGKEDPETFLSFRREYAFPLETKGKETIDALGLNTRARLVEDRRESYERLALIYILSQDSDAPESAPAQKLLARSQEDSGEYAAMVRAALRCAFADPAD